ncbi:MAG: TonB-dependent receptor [Leptolyngbya sp. SIO4C5]|nr:TonB-dependent receptor [Leptolyngbya sp. SIO4C5]
MIDGVAVILSAIATEQVNIEIIGLDVAIIPYLEYGLSGTLNNYDYVFNASWETFGFAFDGAGDQIPGEDFSLENGRSINLLGKLGVNIDENQRLQVSINHVDEDSEAEFISDLDVDDDPDAEKARAIPFDFECIDFECGDDRIYTTLSLNYNHDDIFGSQLRLQGFYRHNFNSFGFPSLDDFSTSPVSAGRFSILEQESERFGGRLEVETPFSETFNLLWGADYSSEDASQTRTILDEVDTNQQTRLEFGEEAIQAPPYTTENLGLFAQAQWDINPRWLLSGGVRYENIGVSTDDYTLIAFRDTPVSVEGGSVNSDDVVFNIGTVYDLTDEVSVFASFAQGFGVPDFGRLFRAPSDEFRSLEEDLEFTAPQKVNNYELGFRGQWDDVQFSLAGFYNDSELGVALVSSPGEPVEVARGPQRIYGVEATIDWQPSPTWQLGGIISWNEGENDLDEDGDFDPLNSFEIQPIKITAYVENETLPGWRNRLQALFVGGRDRAFDPDNGPDFATVESYFLLDYISSIQLGPGTVQIGIQNLLDEEYVPIASQLRGAFGLDSRIAAPGRTISIGYRVTF